MNIYKMPNGDMELADYPARKDESWTYIMWVVVHQCNLRCYYCVGASWRDGS